MIHTQSYTQMKTQQSELKLLSSNIPTNIAFVAGTHALGPTTTAPTGANIVPNDIFNYIKILPFVSTSPTNLRLRVTGWRTAKNGATTLYVPYLLADITSLAVNTDSTAITINSVSGFKGIKGGSVSNSSLSNVKYIQDSAATNTVSGTCLIDTMGSSLIEFDYFATGSGAADGGQIFYGFI
jgi:hypothetical protein